MPDEVTVEELKLLKTRAGNLGSQKLRDVVQRMGYVHARTTGGHHLFTKADRRTIVIQEKMTSGTALGIINRLIRELQEQSSDH